MSYAWFSKTISQNVPTPQTVGDTTCQLNHAALELAWHGAKAALLCGQLVRFEKEKALQLNEIYSFSHMNLSKPGIDII